ncbi:MULTISPECIES: phosphotransferase [Rhizobium/Agrobacterium group]|uniref:phosphotransferase n=1 Tax=Rhizobium/Agrobacterium group TaxID=227290 RepID=UPI0008766658|nr:MULTISPECIES: phosphotransferase [Rhizobium/Agrobacterium group]MCZ7498088.1 phosphotransferase [Rhizobium rhizogenes]NTE33199.1 phosphotransferase [Agrobacterium tumefaciens]NTE48709.1 phosphotransferase [Agrobacterium tumefaciens]NTE80128.1 phosphotransferase [Agrobacterium tumefaciens]SCY56392.1 tRNA A-37 threonylcarbamoyl transferase component Bud32 [Rhizobium sp. NFACC06-2]
MLVNENQAETAEGFRVHLDDADIATLMHALLKSERRVQKVELSQLTVWIKRQGTETPSWWIKLQTFLAKLLPYTFMRPSPPLDGAGLMRRELDTLQAFKASGFPVPPVIYSSRTAVVLGDVGPTIIERMDAIKAAAPAEHDALLVKSAEALGELHAAGLCHGRPHVRDFFLEDGRVGFMDFEERPQEVMPLETAQARDIWLLFLQVATRACDARKTCDAAFARWRENAPPRALEELCRLTGILGRFLPVARLIGRVRMGSDLRRFIMATDYLMNAVNPEAAVKKTGKAGKDD